MRITISGPPGSGKTTACNKLSEKLNIKAEMSGQIFRNMAKEMNLTLSELSVLAEDDPSIDRLIDNGILEIARNNSEVILESRLSAHMLTRHNISAFRIYLDASSDIRMSRVGIRECEPTDEVCKKTEERQASEAKRYKLYYDIDIGDKSVYDLILNTDNLNPDEVLEKILNAIEGYTC